jgi:hypothetical protein
MKKIVLCVLFIAVNNIYGWSQHPFQDEIEEFVKADSISMPPAGAVLFVGSSSIALWKNLQQDFPSHKVINRGFGGSTLVDALGARRWLM